VPIDAALGRQAGEYLRRYRKSHAVELGDALIAASAVANGAQLWTRNRKHYPLPELKFYD
jgi:predicted nucleic acid-binding protein